MNMLRSVVSIVASASLAFALVPTVPAAAAGEQALPKSLKAQLEQRAQSRAEQGGAGARANRGQDDIVTLIVQLAATDAAAEGGAGARVAESSTADAVKAQIADIIAGQGSVGSAMLQSADAGLDIVAEYHTILNGFAVKLPHKHVDAVRKLAGVKSATISRKSHTAALSQKGAALASVSGKEYEDALKLMEAANSSETGQGSVVAVIDSGFDVHHEAFSGTVASPRYADKGSVDAVLERAENFNGRDYQYVNSKIPFAYDYYRGSGSVAHEEDDDHGTHVAGIVAANGGSMRGVAPDAQLLAMKVGDEDGAIDDADVIEAVEDAIELGADVINMSFGTDAGFSATADELLAGVYESISEHGIVLDAAAGNAYTAAKDNASERDLSYASDPDNATVAASSTFPAALSIASVDAPQVLHFLSAGGDEIAYRLSTNGTTFPKSGEYELYNAGDGLPEDYYPAGAYYPREASPVEGKIALVNSKEISYAPSGAAAGGSGEEGDDGDEDARVDAAVKAELAWLFGAAGVVVYDEDPESDTLPAIYDEALIPVGSVSHKDGQKLLQACDAGTKVSFASSEVQRIDSDTATMSDFSSVGVTPDMQLKPELAAPGGTIYSTLPGGAYGYMSGTSMATPNAAGLSAVLSSKLRSAGLREGETISQRVNALLMSTARPLADSNGTYYSPRKQGAGLASLERALATPAYLSVDGSLVPKACAGDDDERAGTWSFTFNVHNTSNASLSYKLDASALSERIADGLFTQRNVDYAKAGGISVAYRNADTNAALDGGVLEVPANGTAAVKVNLTAGAAFKRAVCGAENGTFVDGFVICTPTDSAAGAPALTLPYVAFYGDWSKVPIFDASEFSGKDAHAELQSYPYSTVSGNPLGANPLLMDLLSDEDDEFEIVFGSTSPAQRSRAFAAMKPEARRVLAKRLLGSRKDVRNSAAAWDDDDWDDEEDWDIEYNPDRYVVAPASSAGSPYSTLSTQTYLLRNAKKLKYTVAKKGESDAVELGSYDCIPKSLSQGLLYGFTVAEDGMDEPPVFDTCPDTGNAPRSGWYTETVTGWADDDDEAADDKYSFDFYLDTAKPQVRSAGVVVSSLGKRMLRVTVLDDSFVAGVQLSTTADRALSDVVIAGQAGGDADDVGGTFVEEGTDSATGKNFATFSFDYDALVKKLARDADADQGKIVVDAYDYGMNLKSGEYSVANGSAGGASGGASGGAGGSAVAVGSVQTVGGVGYKVLSAGKAAFYAAPNAKNVTVPAKVGIKGKSYSVTGISASAFAGAKKCKTLTVKSKALTKAGVKGCLKGSSIKTVKVKVGKKKDNKAYVKKYKKLFTKGVAGKKVKVK